MFYHFAGATPCSNELHPMLRRLLLVMETVPVSAVSECVINSIVVVIHVLLVCEISVANV